MTVNVPRPTTGRNSYLDALRGVAVGLVVLYHLPGQPLKGGFIGVDLFMVLSGFLVTRSFMNSAMSVGDVLAFWQRRAQRVIAPALVLVLAVLAIRAFSWRISPRIDYWDAASAAGFVSNWRFILSGTDYFRTASGVSPFQHLWSLSVEEQFYLVWPVLFVLFRRRIKTITSVLILLSFGLMLIIALSGDFSRAYFGTDTRSGTLLAGALLAVQTEKNRGCSLSYQPSRSIVFDMIVLLYMLLSLYLSGSSRYMYQGGFVVVAVLGIWLVLNADNMTTDNPSLFFSRMIFHGLRGLGLRSYSIYLVHWPVFVLLSPRLIEMHALPRAVVLVTVSLILGEFMYQSIEQKFSQWVKLASGGTTKLVAASVAVSMIAVGAGFLSADLPVFLRGEKSARLTATEGTRVLFVGDSVVLSLVDLGLTNKRVDDISFDHVAVSGCGLLPGLVIDEEGEVYEPSRACVDRMENDLWGPLASRKYDLIVWLSPWDAEDRKFTVENATQQGSPDVFVAQMSEVVKRLGGAGSKVAIVTVPARADLSIDESQGLSIATMNRYRAANQNFREAAEQNSAHLIDLHGFVCSGEIPCRDQDRVGNRYRPIDGIHFSGLGGEQVVGWLQKQVKIILEN